MREKTSDAIGQYSVCVIVEYIYVKHIYAQIFVVCFAAESEVSKVVAINTPTHAPCARCHINEIMPGNHCAVTIGLSGLK